MAQAKIKFSSISCNIFLKNKNILGIQIYEKAFINLALYVSNFKIPTYLQAKNMYIGEIMGLYIHKKSNCTHTDEFLTTASSKVH